ncbi:ABC transporter substrate-binding protein [Frondihabitans cladoniiphilus]|uniref:Thiamine pyrimidine synthase n=1 Tax=Frondihabitans cladoniiphilus TaxID=715785 RepID=A0ABP8WAG7_9MICO
MPDRSSLTSSVLDRRGFLRLIGAGGTVAGAGLLLAACSTDSGSGSSSGSSSSGSSAAAGATAKAGAFGTISVALSWIKNSEFAGEYFAVENGYYTKAGFTGVTLLAGGGQTTPTSDVLAGQALVGIAASIQEPASSIAQGAAVKVIGAHFVRNPSCFLSLAEKTPIRKPADLKGKNVGIQAGAGDQVNAFLAANGLKPTDINGVTVQYDIAPLIAGKVDCFLSFSTNEPLLAKADGYTPVLLEFSDYGQPLVGDCFVVLTDTIANKRDELKAFLKAEAQGWADAVKDPAKGAGFAVDKYGKDQNLAIGSATDEAKAQVALMSTADTNKHGLFTMTDSLVAGNIKALKELGTSLTASKLFDLTLLEEVYKENPDLIVTLPTSAS